ncbi:hypothetical protein HQ585_17525 [candidate division KSB1 bacterium]|nr:hypothetical protein [candidate division KSB1 bacterium]
MKEKKYLYFTMLLSLALIFILVNLADASVSKWIRVGNLWNPVIDSGDQSMNSVVKSYYYDDGHLEQNIMRMGFTLVFRDWVDEFGGTYPYMNVGHAHEAMDETRNVVPIPDEFGVMIRKYVRYMPPTVTVDGAVISDPYPLTGDAVDPDKVPGTADICIESTFRTKVGIEITQRVFAWSTAAHDDYHVYDWTFTNTGNVDADDEVELPDQVLHDVYFSRTWSFQPDQAWEPFWHGYYGQYPGDSLRMVYGYGRNTAETEYNSYGLPRESDGWLQQATACGETWLHTDRSCTDHTNETEQQPHQYGYESIDFIPWALCSEYSSPSDWETYYRVVTEGFGWWNGSALDANAHDGTIFNLRYDHNGVYSPDDAPLGFLYWGVPNVAFGPYNMQPGDHFRIVWATAVSSLSPKMRYKAGKAWKDETCDELWGDRDYKLPPWAELLYGDYPEYDSPNDRAKDSFVYSAVDSLFMNANAAKWGADNDWQVPVPPPAPCVKVSSLPDKINIAWGPDLGTLSEDVSDFAGYRVYRAQGDVYYNADDVVMGDWQLIFECGEGTDNALVHEYNDETAERGQEYYYHVAAFDDGVGNEPGVKGIKESLESGRYLNMTTVPATLTKPASSNLAKARVVPNPFNIKYHEKQYIGAPDKIMFMELPPVCTITIYSESGDLVKTLEHTNGSGDEPWGIASKQHSTTDTGQLIVSGLYIAHIESPDGESVNLKFFVIR